jgi:hypothetical protein
MSPLSTNYELKFRFFHCVLGTDEHLEKSPIRVLHV